MWLLLKNRHYQYLRLKDGAKPPAHWLDAAIHWTPPVAVAREQEATQVVATQLDAPTQGETQEATCPDPKRHKANDSQDPFVGGGKSNASLSAAASNRRGEPCLPPAPQSGVEPRRLGGMSCISLCRTEDFEAMRRAIGLSVRPGSVGRVPDMPVGNDTAASIDCPCGWKPPLHVHSSVRQARVRTHWRVCEGRLLPILDAGIWSALLCQRLATV